MGAYLGYRLKIKSNSFPNYFMNRGSWKAGCHQRLINSWYDANGKLHENYYPEIKAEIEFSIKEHNLEEHAVIAQYFSDKKQVYITYWDDDLCDYKSFIGKINDIAWEHNGAYSDDIQYKPSKVIITEY